MTIKSFNLSDRFSLESIASLSLESTIRSLARVSARRRDNFRGKTEQDKYSHWPLLAPIYANKFHSNLIEILNTRIIGYNTVK
jgi:hypothetical protein